MTQGTTKLDEAKATSDYYEALRGMYGYITFATTQGDSAEAILCTLAHDLRGLVRKEEGFLPRTHSYTKYILPARPTVPHSEGLSQAT